MPHDPDATFPRLLDTGDSRPRYWREGLPILAGGSVRLREPRVADAPALVEALADSRVGRFMSRPPNAIRGFERFIAWIQGERRAGRGLCYAILPTGADRAAGLIQVRSLEPSFTTAEWGFALDPSHWGTGVFMEAARIALDFAFRVLRVHRLEARASVANGRGNGVLRKLGAVPEGVLRQSLEQASERVDQVLWAMLDEEWLRGEPPTYDLAPTARPPEVPQVDASPGRAPRPRWCDELPVLASDLATVRELEAEDAVELLPLLLDPEVRRFSFSPPSTGEAFAHFVAWSQDHRRNGKYACFGIVPRSQTKAVGLIQLRALDPSFQTAEWGFALGRPYWGTGLFTDAARLLLDFAFGTVGVHRLEARSAVANERATHALRRLGAVFEGALRQSFLIGGQYHDDALYSLLQVDWRRQNATLRRSIA
jgi:ribosomal-protein-alanine N-acetyltransferase